MTLGFVRFPFKGAPGVPPSSARDGVQFLVFIIRINKK